MGAAVTPAQRGEARELPNVHLFGSTYALEWMDNAWEDVDGAGDWLLGIARDFRPDVVHLNGYAHAALEWNAPVIVVAHSCVLSWWSAVKKGDAPHGYDEYRNRVRAGLDAAALVVAPTAAMLDSLRVHYTFAGESRVISNARDARLFAPEQKQDVIFAAGRLWDEAKNLAALEAAAPSVNWPIEVAGDTTHPNGRELQFKSVGSLGKLPQDALVKRLASASIYALPARYEPFGLSVVEAALSGCALVLGDIPTLREVWGDAAMFVQPDDYRALAATLNRLIADREARAEYSRRARERGLRYSPAQMAEGYRSVYRELLGGVVCAVPSASAESVATPPNPLTTADATTAAARA